MRGTWLLVGLAALGAVAVLVRPLSAGTEEFSTFDVEAPEEDDESLLDHFMTRMPHAWRDEWEHSPQAIRTAQGCLTSGQWFIDTDLKLRSPLGRRARFGLALRQSQSDVTSYEYLDFSFAFPTRFGTPGAMFRPLHDKSRQDFALTWEAGSDTSSLEIATAFTIEDVFNNLWAFRQDRVGNQSEPYLRRPYEPGLRIVTRHEGWRAEIGGRYLTPSRKQVQPWVAGAAPREVTLWGALGHAAVEARWAGVEWDARAENHQARSTDLPIDLSTGDAHSFRRRWSVEIGARGRVAPRLVAELRGIYQDRDQDYRPPLADGSFGAIDRLAALETQVELTPALAARVGALFDRVTVAHAGATRWPSYGTRTESRAFVGLLARFGRVSVTAVEGIELDPEPYEVWWVHDKGFLNLQATF